MTRILVRPPALEDVPSWLPLGWRAEPDPIGLADEHARFRAALESSGAEVIEARGEPGNLDSIYVYDPVLVTPQGAILLQPGKAGRRGEPDALARDLPLPVLGCLTGDEFAEGGDTVWLDERTLLLGHTYRTNAAGIEALRRLLPEVNVLAFHLPHFHGKGEVLHLRSLLNPIARKLVVGYVPLMPVPLVELLEDREIQIVEVPDEEFETMGPNVLGLPGGRALALAGNRVTKQRLEDAGVEVVEYAGDEISLKGDGGPTCLTLPVDFDAGSSS
ncbi:MAG TPA: arginine deiminase family protein [Gaiellaceae bacterium]|nr:arginine deiminase family protein [Gaiellaceae bacterium]